ncbi:MULTISPECIES: DUF3343 domain-containing protein [Caloramator]|jgi:hypothetical protein|uniref:Putative Se/S carrier protein-like domain-containing protein n=1 Tax=Caloramator australicus RC3 TaxID=857293 RepID=I7LIG3_9CLOT|nr:MULTISPECIES: DUF3343 domain-containing protein [Caloramator]MDO6354590.1 DUF3343 domain-containing protein [Caloramator sp. CAR-1]WDU82926.1 DUF3343 domain-containing protein [Caloramator sp. Dgby_cultured_2]CCJ32932.1 hypothetical protein CAAU_0848 [Caloramator australicus RC3]
MKNYILFPSYNEGLRLSSLLNEEGIKHTIAPTPRQLSTCCGMSIIYKDEDEDKIKKIVEDYKIGVIGFYTV